MKKLNTLFVLIMTILVAQGQDTDTTANKYATIEAFQTFLNKVCALESDSLFTQGDTTISYNVLFMSQGSFVDPKSHFERLCETGTIAQQDYIAQVAFSEAQQVQLSYTNRRIPYSPIKTCMVKRQWGESLRDSLWNIYSEPAMGWMRFNLVKSITFPQNIGVSYGDYFSNIEIVNTIDAPHVISYSNGQYLIIDITFITYIGSQTDSGFVTTFYLERRE